MNIPKTFLGYKRENGRIGTRNYVIILPVDEKFERTDFFVIKSRPSDITITARETTVLIVDKGEEFEDVSVTYEEDKPIRVKATDNLAKAFLNGVDIKISLKDTAIKLCYNMACFNKNKKEENNYIVMLKDKLAFGGNGFGVSVEKAAV